MPIMGMPDFGAFMPPELRPKRLKRPKPYQSDPSVAYVAYEEDRLWSPVNMAWLAGLVEGEGCIRLQKSNKSVGASVIVQMTDGDVIERLQSITGLGCVTGPYYKKKNGGSTYKHTNR